VHQGGIKKHKDKWIAIAPGKVYLGIFATEEAAAAYQDAVSGNKSDFGLTVSLNRCYFF
jgi:hypothetical protein